MYVRYSLLLCLLEIVMSPLDSLTLMLLLLQFGERWNHFCYTPFTPTHGCCGCFIRRDPRGIRTVSVLCMWISTPIRSPILKVISCFTYAADKVSPYWLCTLSAASVLSPPTISPKRSKRPTKAKSSKHAAAPQPPIPPPDEVNSSSEEDNVPLNVHIPGAVSGLQQKKQKKRKQRQQKEHAASPVDTLESESTQDDDAISRALQHRS